MAKRLRIEYSGIVYPIIELGRDRGKGLDGVLKEIESIIKT